MIELGVVDLSADGRRRLSSLLERWSWTPPDSRVSVPRISLHLLSPEEVRFNGSLDVCVIGPELVGCDAAFVSSLRQQLPDKILLCVLDSRTYSFGLVEQLGRLGVDDVLVDTASSDEFYRRILLLQRRVQAKKRGRLVVVDSARGGVGRTFVAAAVAEGWYAQGESVCLVDCDVLSQDLTRFLHVRPHINEALRVLIEQQRVITAETSAECVHNVWLDEERFGCVPPPAGSDDSIFATSQVQRSFIAVLESLLVQYDRVVVDTSGLVSSARNALFQVCDDMCFVVNRDASAAFANRQTLSLIAGCLKHDATLATIINDTGVGSASLSLLKKHVVVIAGRPMRYIVLPRSPRAAGWACSGYTAYRFLHRNLRDLVVAASQTKPARARLTRVCYSVLGVAKAAAMRVLDMLGLRWGRKARESASREPWGRQPVLAANPLLSLASEMPHEGALVSKPVLLG